MARPPAARPAATAVMANAALLLATLAGVGCGLGGDSGLATDGSGDTGGETGTALEIPDAPAGPDCSARDCGAAGRCVVVGDRALCRCDQGHAADETTGGPCIACPPANDDPIVRDLVPVSVSGEITVDGVSLLGDTVNQGLVELVGEQEGDRIPLGSVQSASYDVRVLPGTYALDFAFGTQGSLVPQNQRVQIRESVQIDADRTLDVDIETATVTGVVTIAGRPVLDTPADYGVLYLVDQRTGGEVFLGPTSEGDFFVRVARGTYDLVYAWAASFEAAPMNSTAVLETDIEIDGPTELDVDVPAVTLDGEIRLANQLELPPGGLGGNPVPAASSAVVLRSTGRGGIVRLGTSDEGDYEVRLIPDTYEVLVESFVPGPGAPLNPSGRLWSAGELRISADRTFDVEIPTVRVAGSLTIGGVRLYEPLDYGDVFLRDVHEDRLVPLGPTWTGSYAVEVLPGRYDVIYAGRSSTGLAPQNAQAVIVEDLELMEHTALDIDVPAVRVSGEMTVNPLGEPGPSPNNPGSAVLLDHETGTETPLGSFSSERYEVVVVPGHYDVLFSRDGSTSIAHSRRRLVEDLEITEDTVADLELRPTKRRFTFTIDGEPPDTVVGANFYLRSDDEQSDARLDPNTDTGLLPGAYWLEYEGTGNAVVIENRRVRLECLTLVP